MVWTLILEIILIGISLSMDAFAVSICDGMVYSDLTKKKGAVIPVTFGLFQAAMPLIGFFIGTLFIEYIEAFDHWVAFILLLLIGGKMMYDGINEICHPEEELKLKKFSAGEILLQGVATSIDALAVGISMLAMDGITVSNVWWYAILIGVTTLSISSVGLIIGIRVGKLFKNKASAAEIVGGLVLIAIGIKILIEGLL